MATDTRTNSTEPETTAANSGRDLDSDYLTVAGRWRDFLQVRNCPYCGSKTWWAEVKDPGTWRQRWVYSCVDRRHCRGLWGPPKFIELLDTVYREKWRLPVSHRTPKI